MSFSQSVPEIDLSVYNAKISNNPIMPDSNIMVSCTVKNIGDTASLATSLNIYISSDNNLSTTEDEKLNFFIVSALNPNDSVSDSTLIKIPHNITKGNWYIILYIHPTSQDKDMTNNTIVIPITYTQIINKDLFNENLNLSIYPNPVKDKLFINTNIDKSTEYSIYSIDGKLINKSQINDKVIDMEYLYNGIYFINISNDSKKLNSTIKVVKE